MHISPTDEFGDDDFIALNHDYFDKYIDHRVHGYSQYDAFMRVFGAAHWQGGQAGHIRLAAIEASNYYQKGFESRLKAKAVDELWNSKTSVNELLQLVRGSSHVRDSVRLSAIKELNLIVGIVVVDENGKTRAGKTLGDFYDDVESAANHSLEEPKSDPEVESADPHTPLPELDGSMVDAPPEKAKKEKPKGKNKPRPE